MTTTTGKSFSARVKEKAYNLGFDLCGIAPSGDMKEHGSIIRHWCSSGMNGNMTYLEQNIEKRINPASLVPNAKSVIVTGLNYYTEKKQLQEGVPIISRYAYGDDYHDVIKGKLNKILDYIIKFLPGTDGKCFVDSAPVIEKAWAREAGLGWPGRHSILINNTIGSFFFIGVIVTNNEFKYDKPIHKDYCVTCRACIDACPTGAINENRTIDARRCISYLTVESKNPIPDELAKRVGRSVFGCDICQEVCPWNKNAKEHKVPEFFLSEEIQKMTKDDWVNLSESQYNNLFRGTPVERRKYGQFMRNVTNVTNMKT